MSNDYDPTRPLLARLTDEDLRELVSDDRPHPEPSEVQLRRCPVCGEYLRRGSTFCCVGMA